jgi:hypothetical protein
MSVRTIRKFTAAALAVAALWASQGTYGRAAELKPETMKAWTAYVEATERRIADELRSKNGFLALDFHSGAASARRSILSGSIPVYSMKSLTSSGAAIDVPAGMIHHWRGSVFIPGADLNQILFRIENPTAENTRQQDVLASSILGRSPESLKLYLKLQRSKIVTVVYNTEHLVRVTRYGGNRAFSSSVATKIAELDHPNTAEEREKPEGNDRGFLWRLNSYWRYEQVDRGVIVECESISLSRSIPSVLEFFVRPIIDRVAKESMERTLASFRDRIMLGLRQKAVTQVAVSRP